MTSAVSELPSARPLAPAALPGDRRKHPSRPSAGRLDGVRKALSALREYAELPALLDAAPALIGEHLDFHRVIVSELNEQQWRAVAVHVRDDERAAARLLSSACEPAFLDVRSAEAEMARGRRPVLVTADATPRRPTRVFELGDYVAAPLAPEGGVIGFVHADRHRGVRPLDEFDQSLLAVFTEAFGHLLRGLVLRRRLDDQLKAAQDASRRLTAHLAQAADADVALRTEPSAAPCTPIRLAQGSGRLNGLLTPREAEVVQLLAAGQTNAQIAARLVLAEGTIKSHVKHILRKLRARNRAEAAAKYIRINQMPAHVDVPPRPS